MWCKFVFFDCDGVLSKDMWDYFHKNIGMPEKMDNQWMNDFHRGKITLQDWTQRLEHFYRTKGLTKSFFEKILNKNFINPEAKPVVEELRKRNINIAIISGGFDFYVKQYAQRLNITICRADSYMEFDKKGNFTKLYMGQNIQAGKVEHVKEICKTFNISPTETIFVGDSANDLPAFDFTKHGLLYRTKNPEYAAHAWKTIDHLDEIISYL